MARSLGISLGGAVMFQAPGSGLLLICAAVVVLSVVSMVVFACADSWYRRRAGRYPGGDGHYGGGGGHYGGGGGHYHDGGPYHGGGGQHGGGGHQGGGGHHGGGHH